MPDNIEQLIRENIRKLIPYSSARHEFTGKANVYLDANENSFGSPLPENFNRYPDPLQPVLKEKLSRIKGVPVQNMFIGNGSDEAIDVLFRIFCEPGKDNVLVFPPTYGMYEVCAAINNVEVRKLPLTDKFQLDLDGIETVIDQFTKIIFICSPNNPTGNSINRDDVELLLNNFDGLVVIDEAYINFAKQRSFIPELLEYPGLIILQTLSKAWGLAGLRLGMAFASEIIINYMNNVKYPYNISTPVQQLALEALENTETVNQWIADMVREREALKLKLCDLPFVETVYTSDANFLLVKMNQASKIYQYLSSKGIIVRDRSKVILCDDCLRITIGTPIENNLLVETLNRYN